ncbi:MAG: cobaltochelatase subunit CobN, partial [Archaeoglobi archaeon]|nr:cobaltochelatase subunit CobN [Archaeoglobi archaeon]
MSSELSKERAERVVEAFRKALEIYENINACGNSELSGFLRGLSGAYIEPGPSGSITRGKVEVLPTGRNFFAVDPSSLPTKSAWKVGVET